MALFKHFRGSRASLDAQPLHDGYAYFCVDDGTFHIDCTDAEGNLYRKQINAANAETLCGVTLEELKAEFATQDAVILAEAQAYTDNAIANIDVATDDEVMELLALRNVITPVSDSTGYTYLDIDSKILVI